MAYVHSTRGLGNLYHVLDIKPDASDAEVTRGYKRVSARCHPSRAKGTGARERFERAKQAYLVLSDPEARDRYDRDGFEGVAHKLGRGGGGGGDSAGVTAEDLYCRMHGGRERNGRAKPMDTVVELPVSLESFYNGKRARVSVTRTRLCTDCDARGTKREGQHGVCSDCEGRGELVLVRQISGAHTQETATACPTCAGKGWTVRPKDCCTTCSGGRTVREKKLFVFHIEKGMAEGDHFTEQSEGDEDPECTLPGDVVVVLSELKHETFKRSGPHLLMSYDLTLAEALTGFHMLVQHLDGRQLIVQPTKGTVVSPQQLWQVEGEGLPAHPSAPHVRGHLIVRFAVAFPERLPPDTAAKLAKVLNKPPYQMLLEEGFEQRTLMLTDPSVFADASTKARRRREGDLLPGGRTAVCAHQ